MSDFTTPPYQPPDQQVQLGGTNLRSEVHGGDVQSRKLIGNGGDNLIGNEDFEYDIVDWTASSGCTISKNGSVAKNGSYSLRTQRTSTNGNVGASYDLRMQVKADEVYQLEMYHRAGLTPTAGATCVATITGYDAEGNSLGTISVKSGLSGSTWVRIKHSFFPSAIDPDVKAISFSFTTSGHTFSSGQGIHVDMLSIRSAPYMASNGLVIGSDDDDRLYIFRNELHGRTATDPTTVEVNLSNDDAVWDTDSTGRGLYVANRPVPIVRDFDYAPGPVAPVGAWLDVADRDAGWQQVAYFAQGTCTATGYFTVTLPEGFPTAIVAVTAIELEGFVYTPIGWHFHWMHATFPGPGPPYTQITFRCMDTTGAWGNLDNVAVGGIVLGY